MKYFEYVTGSVAILVGGGILMMGQVTYKGVPSTGGQAKLTAVVLCIVGIGMILGRLSFERKRRKK